METHESGVCVVLDDEELLPVEIFFFERDEWDQVRDGEKVLRKKDIGGASN